MGNQFLKQPISWEINTEPKENFEIYESAAKAYKIPLSNFFTSQFAPKTNHSKFPNLDIEDVLISKVFRVSLEETDKALYLELMLAQLLSEGKETKFRITDLDRLILSILENSERKAEFTKYLLETYHRAYEMIEKKYKRDLGSEFEEIHKIIARYIGIMFSSPDLIGLAYPPEMSISYVIDYFKETEQNQIVLLFHDILTESSDNNKIVSFFFRIIYTINNQSSFYAPELRRKALFLMKSLIKLLPDLGLSLMEQEELSLKGTNGSSFQMASVLASFFVFSPIDKDISKHFNFSLRNQKDDTVHVFSKKVSFYLSELVDLVRSIYFSNQKAAKKLENWFFLFINLNVERNKIYYNQNKCATIPFVFNVYFVLFSCYSSITINNQLTAIASIDYLFPCSSTFINFEKQDRISQEYAKDIVELTADDQNNKDYNLLTKLFFTINCAANYLFKPLNEQYSRLMDQLYELNDANEVSKVNELYGIVKGLEVYIYCDDSNGFLLQNVVDNIVYTTTLNSTEYNIIKGLTTDINKFTATFLDFIEEGDNTFLSLQPLAIISNIVSQSIMIRKFKALLLTNNVVASKALAYFSLFYCSSIHLIKNPHLRTEILDVLVYLLVIHPSEERTPISQLKQLVFDPRLVDQLIPATMIVFVDAERMGTSNQFYEKFNIRHRILYLLKNVNVYNKAMYDEQIKRLASERKELATRVINLLIFDISYLSQETISKLTEVRKLQSTLEDAETMANMTEEEKAEIVKNMKESRRRLKVEIKLFLSSLEFLEVLSKVLQENFMKFRLGERLATLLNHVLNIFVSKKSEDIKVCF